MRYKKPSPVFLSVSTDMADGIKKWKRHTLSTQNDLALGKKRSTSVQYVFAVSPNPELSFRQTDGQIMSNAIVADQLLAAEATNNHRLLHTRFYVTVHHYLATIWSTKNTLLHCFDSFHENVMETLVGDMKTLRYEDIVVSHKWLINYLAYLP